MRPPDPLFRAYREYIGWLTEFVLPLLEKPVASKLLQYLRTTPVALYIIDADIIAIPRASRHCWTVVGAGGIQVGGLYPTHLPAVAALLSSMRRSMYGIPLAVWLLWYEDYPWLREVIDKTARTYLGKDLYSYLEDLR